MSDDDLGHVSYTCMCVIGIGRVLAIFMANVKKNIRHNTVTMPCPFYVYNMIIAPVSSAFSAGRKRVLFLSGTRAVTASRGSACQDQRPLVTRIPISIMGSNSIQRAFTGVTRAIVHHQDVMPWRRFLYYWPFWEGNPPVRRKFEPRFLRLRDFGRSSGSLQ